jgi:RNA polymerase sigma-70 factor (ECF subfamily)
LSRELVEQAMQGSREAFTVLVDRAHARLVGTAGLILRDRGWAEDAAQDALVRAWRDLPSLRDPERFDAWLHRLLVRSCSDQLRRHRHELTEVELLADRAPRADGGAATRGVDDRDELERGLRRLTDEQRTVIALRYYLGLTDVEVATATGLPVGTVKSRISRSLESLRAALAAEARGVAPRPSRKAGES